MNLKQAKRLRRLTNSFLRKVTGIELASVRDVAYDYNHVASKRNHYYVVVPDGTDDKGFTKYKRQEDTAIQVRVKRGIGRGIYKRVKQRVQANRRAKRAGILSGVRDDFQRAIEATTARGVEHSGTAGVQRQHSNVL